MEKAPQTRVRKRTRTVAPGAPPTGKRITLDPNRAPQGQKSLLLDKAMLARLCDALVAGNTIKNACTMAKITETTYFRWLDESKDAPEGHPLRLFRESVKEARAHAAHRNVMIIQKAAPRQWQAAAWFLERAFPDEWGRVDHMRIGGDGSGQPILNANLNANVEAPDKVISDEGALVALQRILSRRMPPLLDRSTV